jgi:AcrR family transcriptional regulator
VSVAEDRQARRHAMWREAILEAAAAEFAEHGYGGATLTRIGDRVGLSKQALLADLLEQVTDRIAEAAAVPTSATATERLRAFVRAHVTVSTESPKAAVLGENLDVLMARAATSRLAQVRDHHEQRLAEILTAGVTSGEFQVVAVTPAVKLLFGALNSIPRWYDPDGRRSLDELCDQVVDMVLSGLAGR